MHFQNRWDEWKEGASRTFNSSLEYTVSLINKIAGFYMLFVELNDYLSSTLSFFELIQALSDN